MVLPDGTLSLQVRFLIMIIMLRMSITYIRSIWNLFAAGTKANATASRAADALPALDARVDARNKLAE